MVKKIDYLLLNIGESSYRGYHKAPSSREGAPLHDMTVLYPEDIYSVKAVQYYGHYGGNNALDRKAINIIQSYRDKPNKKVTIYRAIPDKVDGDFSRGDWVTITKEYAKDHGDSNLEGRYKIINKVVRAKDIFTEANSIHEFGYDPQ